VPELIDQPGMCSNARSGEIIASAAQPWMKAYEHAFDQARHPPMLLAAE
jgi:hypothetical protein